MKYYYRLCERKDGELLTLFHAGNFTTEKRSRVIPVDKWIAAEVKPAWDGSRKTAKEYISGFHVFEDPNECEGFIKMFRKERELVMVKCEIGDTWEKVHSPSNILLTNRMKVVEVIKRLK